MASDPPIDQRGEWLEGIAETLWASGRKESALAYFKKFVEASGESPSLMRMADLMAEQKRWKEAADWYEQAWERDKRNAVPLYLRGWALKQNGQKEQGDQQMKMACLLPLANDEMRYQLAEAMSRHELNDAAIQEHETISRTGKFMNSWYAGHALDQLAHRAIQKKDFASAARFYERRMLNCLRAGSGFLMPEAYLMMPSFVHSLHGRDHLAAGRMDEAIREAWLCLDYIPGDVELVIDLAPKLEKHGRKKEADEIFSKVYDLHEKICADYSRSAGHHNNLAWMAANCGRRLDDALRHAQKAVELDSDNSAFLDTLAEVRFRRGDQQEAMEVMKKCLKQDPKSDYFQKQLKRFEAGVPSPNPLTE